MFVLFYSCFSGGHRDLDLQCQQTWQLEYDTARARTSPSPIVSNQFVDLNVLIGIPSHLLISSFRLKQDRLVQMKNLWTANQLKILHQFKMHRPHLVQEYVTDIWIDLVSVLTMIMKTNFHCWMIITKNTWRKNNRNKYLSDKPQNLISKCITQSFFLLWLLFSWRFYIYYYVYVCIR